MEVLRRQGCAQDCVKSGQSEASVRLKLFRGTKISSTEGVGRRDVHDIECIIKRKGERIRWVVVGASKSFQVAVIAALQNVPRVRFENFLSLSLTELPFSYSLDGTLVSRHEVAALAESLQIQTDNLCQFLPQDAVRDFPKARASGLWFNAAWLIGSLASFQMTPNEIFLNSVRAVGDSETLRLHEDLCANQASGNRPTDRPSRRTPPSFLSRRRSAALRPP